MEELILWTEKWAYHPNSKIALFLLAFAESSFFPVPPDVLLIALGVLKPNSAIYLAGLTTMGSVMGGCFGYLLGLKGGLPLLRRFFKKDKLEVVHNLFEKYEYWAITIAAFTPIPYKVFTIAAGIFYIKFIPFIFASLIGRGGRFFLVGFTLLIFGEKIKSLLRNYFDYFSLLLVVGVILGFLALRLIKLKKEVKTP
jgi:membrane protein YqaA with SNARE-associated domain